MKTVPNTSSCPDSKSSNSLAKVGDTVKPATKRAMVLVTVTAVVLAGGVAFAVWRQHSVSQACRNLEGRMATECLIMQRLLNDWRDQHGSYPSSIDTPPASPWPIAAYQYSKDIEYAYESSGSSFCLVLRLSPALVGSSPCHANRPMWFITPTMVWNNPLNCTYSLSEFVQAITLKPIDAPRARENTN